MLLLLSWCTWLSIIETLHYTSLKTFSGENSSSSNRACGWRNFMAWPLPPHYRPSRGGSKGSQDCGSQRSQRISKNGWKLQQIRCQHHILRSKSKSVRNVFQFEVPEEEPRRWLWWSLPPGWHPELVGWMRSHAAKLGKRLSTETHSFMKQFFRRLGGQNGCDSGALPQKFQRSRSTYILERLTPANVGLSPPNRNARLLIVMKAMIAERESPQWSKAWIRDVWFRARCGRCWADAVRIFQILVCLQKKVEGEDLWQVNLWLGESKICDFLSSCRLPKQMSLLSFLL